MASPLNEISKGEAYYNKIVKNDPKGAIATKYPTYKDMEAGVKEWQEKQRKNPTGTRTIYNVPHGQGSTGGKDVTLTHDKDLTFKSQKTTGGGSGTTSTTKSDKKSGTTGGFLQDKISSGQMSLGIDKSMPKLDKTISNATSTSHDIISSPRPSGRVGRVKRRQEQRTANLAKRLQGRAQKATDKATIDATRTGEREKRQGMRAKAKGPDMPQASSTSAKPSGIDKSTATPPKSTTSSTGSTKSSWTFPKGTEYSKLYDTYDPSNTMFKDKADWSANRADAIQQLKPSLRPGGGGTKQKTSSSSSKITSSMGSVGQSVKGGTNLTGSTSWESPKQERKNLLTDMPVDKDATGGRSGSQFSYGSQAEQDKSTHDKYGVTTRGKKVIKVKGFKNK